jgi:hypothetical protein
MKRCIVLTGLLLVLVGLASAGDLTGNWKGAFTFNDQSVPLSFDLKGAKDITGTVTGFPSGVAELKDGKLEGENLTFWVMIEYEGNPVKLVFKGKADAGEIQFNFGTEDGSWGTQFVAKKAAS